MLDEISQITVAANEVALVATLVEAFKAAL
jgi:hypothetical protein